MERHNKIFSLEELAQKRYPVLFDSSTIIGCYNDNIVPKNRSIKDKLIWTEEHIDCFRLMMGYIKKGANFYTIPNVVDELQAGRSYQIKKKLKKMSFDYRGHKEIIELYRKRNYKEKEQTRLANLFQDYDRILELNPDEQNSYNDIDKHNSYLIKIYALSDTDFEISIYGLTIAKKRGPIAIVSNDKKICDTIEDILKKVYICYKLEYFVREDLLNFKKIREF